MKRGHRYYEAAGRRLIRHLGTPFQVGEMERRLAELKTWPGRRTKKRMYGS